MAGREKAVEVRRRDRGIRVEESRGRKMKRLAPLSQRARVTNSWEMVDAKKLEHVRKGKSCLALL